MGALIMTDSFDSITTQETNSSTKKMSIDSLLSASRNPTESSLIQVKNRLSDISLVLQGHDDVNFNEISSKIVEIFEVSVFKDLSSKDKVLTIQAQYIQLLKRSNPQELQNNGGVFYELEQLSSKVSLLLEERFRLHKDVKNLQDYFKTDNTKLFNVITQDMMNDQTNIPGKRKRLEREKVKILENWYNHNSNNPFLNEETVSQMMSETDLTKVQIRNWFSNKRRKERTSVVSAELSDLLKP